MKLINILREWRIIILITLIISSIIAIHPFSPTNGVLIEGVRSPAPTTLHPGQVITRINDKEVNNITDYYTIINNLTNGSPVRITYREEVGLYLYKEEKATPYLAVKRNNKTDIGLTVGKVKSNNLDYGLEIVGGTKVLLSPNHTLSREEAENLVEVIKQRLNLFGLKEVPVNFVTDLSGKQYIRIEFAGATESDVKMLLEKEGNFEGRIGNETVFTGDDIIDVCISGVQCTMIVQPVYVSNNQLMYQFRFQIDINERAAQKFANITSKLNTSECTQNTCYLNKNLALYLDGEPIQDGELRLPESIKGEVLTSASITGFAPTMKEAQKEMKRFQAILQSRSLPVKLNIVSVETISPSIGSDVAKNIFTVFITSLSVVAFIIAIRYRNLRIALPIIFIVFTETLSTLGVAAMIGWTLDLSSIAGILASVGTGLDDQIIITDGILSGEEEEKKRESIKKRIKKAFFVVITSFTASFVSMIPLAFAGAGILKGFAITTMIGITIGVTITRPAFSRIMELILKK